MRLTITVEIPSVVVTALGISAEDVRKGCEDGVKTLMVYNYRQAYEIKGRATLADTTRMRELLDTIRVRTGS